MDLQSAFYILGIIFMAVMLLLMVGILVAVLVIKAKINHLHQTVTEKIDKVKNVTDKGSTLIRTALRFVRP